MSHYWTKNPYCKICGKLLKFKRENARYCSDKCRKAGWRRKGNMLKSAGQISRQIRSFEEYLKDDELSEVARGLLLELVSEIEVQLTVTARQSRIIN